MSNTIKSRTFSLVEDKRARLSNSNFARVWSSDLGTSWTTIRVGCRISMENTSANLTSTPRFAFGICSGTSNIYMDTTTTHWCGILTNAATWVTATNNGVLVYSVENGSGPNVAKRIGSTLTVGSAFGVANMIWDCTVASRSAFFLDITKGSPNFSFKIFSYTTQNSFVSGPDVSVDTLLTQLPLSSPTISNHGSSGAVTQAIDEATNGYFNAVNISWDRTSPAIEISDLAVVRLV